MSRLFTNTDVHCESVQITQHKRTYQDGTEYFILNIKCNDRISDTITIYTHVRNGNVGLTDEETN